MLRTIEFYSRYGSFQFFINVLNAERFVVFFNLHITDMVLSYQKFLNGRNVIYIYIYVISIVLYAVLQPLMYSTINIVFTVPGRPEALRDLPASLNYLLLLHLQNF